MRGEPLRYKNCKRWDNQSDAHCITFSCLGRKSFLARPRPCHWLLDAIGSARAKLGFHLWAYVIMPNHVHLVLWPREATMDRILKSIKLPVTKSALRWARHESPVAMAAMAGVESDGRVHYRFWLPGGGYDRNLRSDSDVHMKIKYVHENPVRRRLVARLEDWPWSSWHTYQGVGNGLLSLDLESLPILQS